VFIESAKIIPKTPDETTLQHNTINHAVDNDAKSPQSNEDLTPLGFRKEYLTFH